jgi:hypothetical protein
MRAVLTGMLLLILFGCDQRQPKMSDAQMQRLRNEAPYLTDVCLEKIRFGGIESLGRNADCEQRLPPRRWRGLWRDDFEGSLFCPAPAGECRNRLILPNDQIWLDLKPRPAAVRDQRLGGLYRVEFIGRETARGTSYSGYAQDIIVDRLISIKEIEPPPPPATKAETVAYFKKCEANGTCRRDWDAVNAMTD